MSVQTSQKSSMTTYRTLKVETPEPVANTVISASPVSPLPYAVNGSYETVRYLVPMQPAMQPAMQQQSYVLMQQPVMQQMHQIQQIQQPVMQQMHQIQQIQQPVMQQMHQIQQIQQPAMQQMMSPIYLQNVQSVSSQDSDFMYRQTLESTSGKSSVFSQSSSPIKSPEPSMDEEEEEEDEEVEVEEVEIVNIIQQKAPPVKERISRTQVRTERDTPLPTKMDTRYFGELLAEVYRKNCDIHSCISEHVTKMRGQKHQLDPSINFKVEREEVEPLIPKGATELTKQQIRYLLQTRLTADKSMRLLLSTFSSLREDLLHMSEDLRRLESEKESLERDLVFKADQARQYDMLVENVRENNRQLQMSLKEAVAAQRSLESQLMSGKNTDSSREFKIKELEGRMRAMEKENELLRQKLAGQASSSTLQIKTEELSRQYNEQLSSMREEKDREIQNLRSQITRIQTQVTSTSTEKSSSDRSLQLKISELLTALEQRQTTITRQEAEIKRLLQEKNDSSKNVTKTIITKRYRNQYPMLGLLSDDYQVTSPIKEDKTIVIERSGHMIKQE